MRHECCVCGQLIRESDDDTELVSHGYCPKCFTSEMAKLEMPQPTNKLQIDKGPVDESTTSETHYRNKGWGE